MFKKSVNPFLVISLFISVIFFSSTTHAQDSVTIIRQNLTEGVTIELNASALAPATNFIVISDSSNQMLALSGLVLNDQNIWIKKSNEAVNNPNTVQWFYDENSQSLCVDINGIKNSFSANSTMQLTILPVKTSETNLSFSIFESSTDSGNIPDGLQKISDIKVDLK